MVDALAVHNELFLIESIFENEEVVGSCTDLLARRELAQKAEKHSNLLVSLQEFIVSHRLENACCTRAHDRFRKRFFPKGFTVVESCTKDQRDIDIRHLSFPITKFLELFGT